MMMIMVVLSTYNEWLSQAIYQFQHAVDIKLNLCRHSAWTVLVPSRQVVTWSQASYSLFPSVAIKCSNAVEQWNGFLSFPSASRFLLL